MNAADRKEFELISEKIDNLKEDIREIKNDMSMAHGKTEESLKFMKENLFDPHVGLWAETKQNTQFRESAGKWRSVIGAGFIGLFFKQLYDLFS